MGYIEQRLTTGESVLYRASLHWVIFLAPGLVAAAGGLAILLADRAPIDAGTSVTVRLIGLGALTVAVALALVRALTRASSELAVTNRRLLVQMGLFTRRSLELMLSKIEGIAVDQDALGRLLDYGTVTVRGAGGRHEAFPRIARPLRFVTAVEGVGS